MAKKLTYRSAYEKLQSIYDELSEGKVDIDDLDNRLKLALEYIRTCKEVLKNQEIKISDVLKEIEKEEK